jgi:Nucleotidyl transferase AbiEii toxin, Type IV TA system
LIDYPDDRETQAQAREHGIPGPVLVRDLVRLVEVLNLKQQDFFSEKSVLSGSMALRCFNSPRFTVYDADFSTTEDAKRDRTEMRNMLRYADDDLEIAPEELVPHDLAGTAWKSEPIRYEPIFTSLAPNASDRQFKADISHRGLIRPGIEQELRIPYDLGIWPDPPLIWIMDPHEIVAEKALGWCVNRQVKHYADLGFMAIVSRPGSQRLIDLRSSILRETLAAKLERMRGIQPSHYAAFGSIEDVIEDLAKEPALSPAEWGEIVYLRGRRDRFTTGLVTRAVHELLVPLLRAERI